MVTTRVQRIMTQPIKARIQIWLFEQKDLRIEGHIVSDKASMLDDAIEYLKSLQLQVQMLSSMQYNMGHMMFPDMQRYMQTLGFMGMSMAMASGGIQRPMMSFAPILPYSP